MHHPRTPSDPRSRISASALALLFGCGPIVNPGLDEGDGGADGTGGGVDESSASADGNADGSDDAAADTGGAVCGDGSVDPGETCDDGDASNGNGCNVDCRASGAPLWSVVVDHAPGGNTYAAHVAISPVALVFAGVTQFDDAGHGGAELWALDLAGDVRWQTPSTITAEIEQVYGLATGSTGDPSLLTSTIDGASYAAFVQTFDAAGGTLRSGVFVGVGSQSYAGTVTIDGLDTVTSVGLDGETNAAWLEGTDQDGGTRWFTQPSAQVGTVAGLGAGGVYVQYAVPSANDQYTLERRDADGAPLWSTTTSCAGVLAVAGDDDVTVVGYADTGVRLCRVAADGAFLGESIVATGAHSITAAGTDGDDVVIGGYTEDGGSDIAPWIGRISAQDVVLWTHAPDVDSTAAFVQSVAVDEGLGIVVAGMSVTTNESYGHIVALTP